MERPIPRAWPSAAACAPFSAVSDVPMGFVRPRAQSAHRAAVRPYHPFTAAKRPAMVLPAFRVISRLTPVAVTPPSLSPST